MRENTSPNGDLGVPKRIVIMLSLLTIAACGLLQATPCWATSADGVTSSAEQRLRVSETYGKLPLHFESNRGQTDPQVKFLSRGAGYTLFLTSTEAVFVFTKAEPRDTSEASKRTRRLEMRKSVTRTVLRATLVGADPGSRLVGEDELPGKANYFVGRDPMKSSTNVPTYAKLRYQDLYRGIDLVYYGNERQLEYDFIVRPGADPARIVLGFQGADRVEVDDHGDLVLHTAAGAIRQRKPVMYQEVDGIRKEIEGGYVLADGHQVGFRIAAYDAGRPLIIDPVLVYSTYLGGSNDDLGLAIAVDADGNAYVTGSTESTDFPTTAAGAFPTSPGGGRDGFVTKLNPAGSALVYSTYLGGSGGGEFGQGIAVDASGSAYVTGQAGPGFPTTPGAFQTTMSGTSDAFVTKLSPSGSALVYSTYLGGSDTTGTFAIAVDAAGNAYVTGQTTSTDFPTTPGAFQSTLGGVGNAFVTKLNSTGSALVYSTYLGGSGDGGFATAIAVDASGNAYVTGATSSTDFPTTPGAFQSIFAGVPTDAFVTKLNPIGSALLYSTYLGGSGQDEGRAIAVDAAGNAYVTGPAFSTDFPTTPGAFQPIFAGFGSDAFVTKLNASGSGLAYSTYLGSSGQDEGRGIAVDAAGNAFIIGEVQDAADFPTTPAAFQPTIAGGSDIFVTKLNPSGSGLVYSTYLGGTAQDGPVGLAVDAMGNVYVTGITESADFPTTPGTFQTTFGGALQHAFVAKIGPFNTPAGTNVAVAAGNSVTVTFPAVVTAGDTGATTSDSGPTLPAGFTLGTPPTFYDVTTTATFAPPASLCITYDPAHFGDPSTLRLLHFETGAWMNVTTSHDIGAHVICGQVNSFSPFVIAQQSGGSALTSLGPANIWVGLKTSDDVGIRFDLRAEVYRNGTELVGSGAADSVPGGSSGFNNARQDMITLTPVAGATFQSGDTVSIKLYVRNACSGSGKNSGAARLWFNDSAAHSRFEATIGGPTTYFLRDAFTLATTAGPGPKKTIDVAAGAKCSPYKTFGTWSTTLP